MVTLGVIVLSGLVAIGTLALDLYGFSKFDDDLGNVVQSSEMGFAGLLNYLILGTIMLSNQIWGAALLVISMAMAGYADYLRKKDKEKKEADAKKKEQEVMLAEAQKNIS
jgi:ABC-type antimicrobial peptide transport system permease subunit